MKRDPDKQREWQQRGARNWQANLRRNGGRGRKALREESALFQFRAVVYRRQWCQGDTPACPIGQHPGTDAHHIWPSDRDKGLHNPNRAALLCRAAHQFVHEFPAWGREHGLLKREGDE